VTPAGPGWLPITVAGCLLVVLGLTLAAPVSIALARARWPRRAPGWSLLLWQAVCLAAGFSVVAGLALLAVEPSGHTLVGAGLNWWTSLVTGELLVWRTACGMLSLAITVVLLASLARTAWRTVSRRRLHRQMVDLLSRPIPSRVPLGAGCQMRLMDHRSAVAYTLPGLHARLVLSTGLVDLLTPAELIAVVEHERSHLRARHDILIMPFQSWVAAFGRLRGVREAARSVGELTEMLADDVAAARSTPDALASALARVALERRCGADGPAPWSMATATTCVTDRVRRLQHPDPLPSIARSLIVVAAAVLLAVPATVLTLTW
jgi:hypothetical protein